MELASRKASFVQLGQILKSLGNNEDWPGFEVGLNEEEYLMFNQFIPIVRGHNGWFTEAAVRQSLASWGELLTEDKLSSWLNNYEWKASEKRIGVVMAGNIPMVGFHDLLSVLLLGYSAEVKLSSDDAMLIPKIFGLLVKIDDRWEGRVEFSSDKLRNYNAVIATGSNNTSRYFAHYFKHVPHLIRKNRTSVAILNDQTSEEDLKALTHDIFDYYGLGCRNVSKLFLSADYDINTFFEGIYEANEVVNHHKYANNYDYNKAVWLLNNEDLLDNGFILLKEDKSLFAPTGSLYYERFADESALRSELELQEQDIQCIVSEKDVPFGKAQQPELWDYADGADTIDFLIKV